MKNQFKLEIENPCSKKFTKFKPTLAGGFCDSCKTDVVNFTEKSTQEIANFFKENKHKVTCGRFSNYQLRTYINPQPKIRKFNFWKNMGLACLSVFSFNSFQAQEINKKNYNSSTKIKIAQQEVLVKGVVSDENGLLPGVSIILEGTTIGTETDFDGKFEFPKKLKKGDVLLFSFVGLDSKKIIISKSTSTIQLKVNMKSTSCILLGKVAVKQVYKSIKN